MKDHYDHLEQLLETAPAMCPFSPPISGGGGHPLKLFVLLEGGIGVIAKVADSAHGDTVRQSHREAAAYRILRLLGWECLAAVTVHRRIIDPSTGVDLEAAVQVIWADHVPGGASDAVPEVWRFRAGIFDALIQHEDRGGANWLIVPASGAKDRLILIDNGNSLRGIAVNSVFYQDFRNRSLSDDETTALKSLIAHINNGADRLQSFLNPAELTGIKSRAEAMLNAGALT